MIVNRPVSAGAELLVAQEAPVGRRALVEAERKTGRQGLEQRAESRVEGRGSLIGRVEPIGDEDQRVRAHVRHRREFVRLVGERLAHVAGRDDRRAPSRLAHDEAGDRQALVETEVLHLARLADREQGVRAVGEIPFDQPFEAGVVNIAVIAERSEHHWDDTADGAWHALKSPVMRKGRTRGGAPANPFGIALTARRRGGVSLTC